jgi:hypothetical protein
MVSFSLAWFALNAGQRAAHLGFRIAIGRQRLRIGGLVDRRAPMPLR